MARVRLDLAGVSAHVARGGDDPDGQGLWSTTLQTTSDIARREALDVAINGDFFASKDVKQIAGRELRYFEGNWARPIGWAMSDGVLWSADRARPALIILEDGTAQIGRFEALPKGARQAIGGNEIIVTAGKNSAGDQALHPRTAVGLSEDGRTLWMVVVDGRREDWSVGISTVDLADELIRLGAWSALNLDGGGSATMVFSVDGQPRVMNKPSDGSTAPLALSRERPVANVLGVRVKREER